MQRTIDLNPSPPCLQEMHDEVETSRVPDPKLFLRRMVPYNLEP